MDRIKAVMPELLEALDTFKGVPISIFAEPHSVTYGKKYAKVQTNGSVYAFIDADGNIYKPASWSAPAKHVRGNIFHDANFSIGHAFRRYSVRYL
jgi:hypothetical protein